ncbi:tigger transposable element-derived protein 6-like [Parasteatoda tepidariorum]|uniref:tigger transposable element-derived protein 6-like n=1 Tax=Parasteatoda tepidariorum TaxID=114398 RepID=UPI0039BCB506
MIENENFSVRAAARAVDIPYSTLHCRLMKLKNPAKVTHVGTLSYIPAEHENELAACLKCMARWGFPVTRKEIKVIVYDFVIKNKEGTTALAVHLQKYCHFKDDMPGEDWISSFMHKHNLSAKKPSILERSRFVASSNPFIIYEFYDLLEKELSSLNIKNKPSHIYNLDETAMFLDPSKTKAVGEKGSKLARATATSGREAVTVMACVNAVGERHPPLIIFSGKKLQSTWKTSKVDKNLTLAVSETGWMTADIFDSWFIIFCEQVKTRPLLIIYDGHKTHMSMNVIAKARSEKISILKLPAHTTDILQPLDKCCFRPLKMKWDKRLTESLLGVTLHLIASDCRRKLAELAVDIETTIKQKT